MLPSRGTLDPSREVIGTERHDAIDPVCGMTVDVGQGDAIALRTSQGRWVLFDAGPRSDGWDAGERVVAPRGGNRLGCRKEHGVTGGRPRGGPNETKQTARCRPASEAASPGAQASSLTNRSS